MSFVDESLTSGEEVVYRARLHWFVFFWPVIFLLLAFLLPKDGTILLKTIFFLLAILKGIGSPIQLRTTEFGVTTKRVLRVPTTFL